MITQDELGRRLKIARQAAGLHQEAVAEELGVPRPTISQMEAGKRGVGSIELARLARLYSRNLEWFLGESSEDEYSEVHDRKPLTVLFRATNLRDEDREVVEQFERFCRAYSDLESLLDLDGDSSLPDYSAIGDPRNKMDAIRQGEQVAIEERRRLDIGDDPIRDVLGLLESQGIRLLVRPLRGSNISGLFLYDQALGPCILINGAEHRNRLAFNAAHEYAHVLMDRRLRARVSDATRFLADTSQRGEFLEVRANSFAAAFLLPGSGIERFLASRGRSRRDRSALDIVDVLYLHRTFGVSFQAALYRLQNLGWLDRGEREALAEYSPEMIASALGLTDDRDLDSDGTPRRFPLRYVALALEAYRRAKISLAKLADLLGKSQAELLPLLRQLGRELT